MTSNHNEPAFLANLSVKARRDVANRLLIEAMEKAGEVAPTMRPILANAFANALSEDMIALQATMQSPAPEFLSEFERRAADWYVAINRSHAANSPIKQFAENARAFVKRHAETARQIGTQDYRDVIGLLTHLPAGLQILEKSFSLEPSEDLPVQTDLQTLSAYRAQLMQELTAARIAANAEGEASTKAKR